MGKGLHNVYEDIVNKLKNLLSALGKWVSEVSHFIPVPRDFAEVTTLQAYVKMIGWKQLWNRSKSNQQSNLTNGEPREVKSSDTIHGCLQRKITIW